MDKDRRLEITEKANNLLASYGLDGQYPVPVEKIPPLLGYKLEFFTSRASTDLQSISGAVDHVDKIIFINKDEFVLRQAFTIAHEIGHIVLHSHLGNTIDYRGTLFNPKTEQESEANLFAAELLMPELQFKIRAQVTNDDISLLSRFFAVSETAVQTRIKSLKLKNS